MSKTNATQVIWMDGEFVPWDKANVHILCHSLHYGLAVFEGVRAYATPRGPAIFRLQDHTARLCASAHIFDMSTKFDEATLNQAQCEIIRRNGLESGYLRPLVYFGAEGLGLNTANRKTQVAIAALNWGAYLGEGALEKGVRVHVSSYTRNSINSMMTKAKATGSYINSLLARQRAVAGGFDEAIMLDERGCVAEGTGENIFLVRKGVLLTPEPMAILEGITRSTIIQLAEEMGLKVKERNITRDELYIAEEAFFTGTAAEVTPIREVDGRMIGNGKRGPVTERLQKLYFDIVMGKSQQHPEWLTYVNEVK